MSGSGAGDRRKQGRRVQERRGTPRESHGEGETILLVALLIGGIALLAAAAVVGFLLAQGRAARRAAPPEAPPVAATEERERIGVAARSGFDALETGIGLMSQFEFEQASLAFATAAASLDAARLQRERSVAELNRAIALMNQSRPGAQEDAIAMLRELLAEQADHIEAARAHYCIGLSLAYLGRMDEALAAFQTAAALRPDEGTVQYQLGQALEQLGRADEALAHYERALELDPFLRSALLGVQRVHARAGRDAEADAALARFMGLESNPRSRLTEFKYTRMGPLSEVVPPEGDRRSSRGPLPGAGADRRILVLDRPKALLPRRGAEGRGGEGGEEGGGDEGRGGGANGDTGGGAIERAGTGAGNESSGRLAGPAMDAARSGVPVAIDLDGDQRTDLFVAGAAAEGGSIFLRQQRDGAFEISQHPLASLPAVDFAAFADFDNDGHPDALVVSSEPPVSRLMRCGADGGYTEVARWSRASDALWADLDHDGDLDLVLAAIGGPPQVLMNRGSAGFEALDERSGLSGLPRDCVRVAIGDLNGDGLLDLAFLRAEAGQIWLNDGFWNWRRDPVMEPLEQALRGRMIVSEFPSTGEPMVVALCRADGARERESAVLTWVLRGPRHDRSWTLVGESPAFERTELQLATLVGEPSPQVLVSGRDGARINRLDGSEIVRFDPLPEANRLLMALGPSWRPALVEWSAAQQRVFIAPEEESWGEVVAIDFLGRRNPSQSMRSNSDGIGTRWAARPGGQWSGGWVLRQSTGPGQGRQPTLVGIGDRRTLPVLFVDWPDGVTQSEMNLGAGRLHRIVETQRQISSCPVIFAWDGGQFRFVTDCLGVGGMGYLTGAIRDASGRIRPQYAPSRPRESVLLDVPLEPSNGAFEVRLTEPMEEACYLDSARLVEWRFPASWRCVLDERMAMNGPEPTGTMLFYREEVAAEEASIDPPMRLAGSGVDQGPETDTVRGRLFDADFRAIEFGEPHPRFVGRLRESGTLTLTFPRALDDHPGRPALVIRGWVEYPYSQTSFAMWQEGASPQPPSIDALDPVTNQWVTLVDEIGFPAGMTRESLLPLSGDGIASIPPGCTTLRIRTSVELYLDRLRLVWLETCPQATRREWPLHSAELAECGYPRKIDRPQKRPDYDYGSRAPLWDCRTQPGFYTRFGVCTELVQRGDGALAIFGPGEEIRLRFEAVAPAQTPSAGSEQFARVWVLELEGWCKDMDRYTGDGATLEPLPEPDGITADERHHRDALHRAFNTRLTGGR